MLKIRRNVVLAFIIAFLFNYCSFGQIWLDNKAIYSEATGYMEGEEFDEAIPLLQLLEKKEVKNANISYKLGLCLLNIKGKKALSIPHLESAIKDASSSYNGDFTDSTAPLKSFLYLGIAYRINNQFKESLEAFEMLKDSDADTELRSMAEYYINQTRMAMFLTDSPSENEIKKINDNSAYSLSNPVVFSDTAMYFMQEKPFYNAVVKGAVSDNILIEKENLTPSIGSDDAISLVSISPDGKRLIFTAYIAGKGYELFYSDKNEKDEWEKYKAFPEPINTPGNESFASISASGKEMYISSNRHGGFGGNDIYISRLDSNKQWSEPINLGAQVNTPFNEIVCSISPDGEILFISSEGHINMGGYDLFYVTKNSTGEWTSPVNFGSPISTSDDDNYVSVSPQNKLYTSRIDKETGKEELFSIDIANQSLPKKVLVKTQLEFNEEITPKEVSYLVQLENMEVIERALTSGDGKTQKLLSEGTYIYDFVYDENVRARQKVVITRDLLADELTLDSPDWEINTIVQSPQVIVVYDILFRFNSYQVLSTYHNMLDSIADLLKLDQVTKIIIEGHTDAIGSKQYNKILSQKRAKAVSHYLLNKGVLKDKVEVQAMGEEVPVARNINPNGTDNSVGRKFNRRVTVSIKTTPSEIVIKKNTTIPKELMLD